MLRIPKDLSDPKLYVNRELSQLAFNRRVLEQAKDPGIPLLERLRFLTISSSNLDEFFEIRAAGLKQQIAYGIEQIGPDGLSAEETLRRVGETAHALVAEQYRLLNQELLPALAREEILLLRRADWTEKQRRWMRRFFSAEVLPVLTPMGIDPAHPFPRVLNKGLSFLITLEGTDAFGRDSGVAVVQVPRSLPRLIRLPETLESGKHAFVMLSSIIHGQVGELFPGMQVSDCYQFRVTRNSDLWVDEEDVDNLLQAVKGELPGRKYGDAVRLEVAQACSEEMTRMLLRNVGLGAEDLYRVDGPVNLNRLAAIYEGVQRPDLKYASFVPGVRKRLRAKDLFEVIRKGDVVLHHPFESFAPVVQLLQQAAADPHMLAIKITVYRTDADSPLVAALLDAAIAGKEVTAVIELRARFDEAANIDIATRLQEAGANVVYGVVGYKAHAKMILIVRREGRRLRRYVHLGTGNYHTGTARAYTDIGFLTCSSEIAQDVHKVFQDLTGLGKAGRLHELLQSPFTLRKHLLERIEHETREAEQGKSARIVARMNALSEPGIIRSLYRASQAGVTIDLVVRGICCLRPGVPGVSENISVRSIVGRFLEHSRVFWFHNGGEGVLYASSADWMARNLFSRVEIAFPIREARLRERVFEECLELELADNVQSWLLQSDGTYVRARPGKRKAIASQTILLQILSEDSGDSILPLAFPVRTVERRRQEERQDAAPETAQEESPEEGAAGEAPADLGQPTEEDAPPRRAARG